jgi:CDP-paratose 2-epimerase
MATNTKMNGKKNKEKNHKVGLVQWFGLNQFDEVAKALEDLKKLNITHLRTNISISDWNHPEAKSWFDWMFKTLGEKVEVLPCIMSTSFTSEVREELPEALKDTKAFVHFIKDIINKHILNYGMSLTILWCLINRRIHNGLHLPK